MNVALVHDWLNGMRGGERCLEVFCELFPEAPIFTLFHVQGSVSGKIERHPIIPSYLNAIPFAKSRYRYFLPFFPSAVRFLNLQSYDLVVSSSHCVAKGVSVAPRTCHISYIHTPMRYIWDQYEAYVGQGRCSRLQQAGLSMLRRRLQRWDVESNAQVYQFIANSHHVAGRIQRQYGRTARVIFPPVDWQAFEASPGNEGFYLMVTAFAPYKKVDLAIKAANELKVPLKIIGSGQDEKRLRQMAGPGIEFLGWQPDHRVREWYSRCLAVLFPGEEDFGIVPLEAMAAGKPVIAYGKGGALETVIPLNPLRAMPTEVVDQAANPMASPKGQRENSPACLTQTDFSPAVPTGVFFYDQSVEGLMAAIQLFQQHRTGFHPEKIRAHVEPFDRTYFKQRMHQVIMSTYKEFCHLTHVEAPQ
jgi:glycosyltransferase involved in cell wall biosynthesis